MSEKTIIQKLEPYKYLIPKYTVVEGKGIELLTPKQIDDLEAWNINNCLFINMVRGSKVENENILPKIDGVLVEQLLEVCLQHLNDVNVGELRSRETSLAITAIEEAQLRLYQREYNRKKKNVLGTYQK